MSESPIVYINKLGKAKGKVLGKIQSGKNVYRYSSLPFAKPPVGELRFQLPVKPEPWDGLLDASKHSAVPIQNQDGMKDILNYMPGVVDESPKTFDEDCLYLSVYTSNPSKTANMPVLFWIYGGGFNVGGESFYDAKVLASLYDVVVVIPNYRLGSFGFLAFGRDTDYPGNVGLHDQIMALKWTQSYIKAFGGNPDNVTIFGQSVGAACASFHVVSPLSKGLFHRAISHSGTFFTSGFPLENGDNSLNALLEELKITEKEPKAVLKRLQSFSSEEILKATLAAEAKFCYFCPVYDGNFFPKPVETMKKETVANNVPYIVGCNSTEGHGVLTLQFPQGFKDGITKESYEETFKGFIGTYFTGLPDEGFDVVTKHYEKNKQKDDKKKWSKIYGDIMTDLFYVSPTIKALNQHVVSKGKTYMYVMSQQPQVNHKGPERARKPEFCECDHGDDLIFTFGLPLTDRKLTFDAKFTEDEKKLSKEWIKYIVNFATNGDPNVGMPVAVKWPEYDHEKRQYLSVQEPFSNGENYGAENYKFWNEVVEPLRAVRDQSKQNVGKSW